MGSRDLGFARALIRAWMQPGDPPRLVMRLIRPADAGQPEATIAVAAGIDESMTVLRTWLERVSSGEAPSDKPTDDAP